MSVGQASYYTYEGSHHCTDCARERFGDSLDDGRAIDIEGNPAGVGFETDELDAPADCNECSEFIMTGLTDTGEIYVIDAILANKGRPEVLERWREEFDWLEERIRGAICDTEFELVADGGDGQYDNREYFSRVAAFVSGSTGKELPEPDGLEHPEWGSDALEQATVEANTILQDAKVDRILSWHGDLPGVLVAASERAWHAVTEPMMSHSKTTPSTAAPGAMEGP